MTIGYKFIHYEVHKYKSSNFHKIVVALPVVSGQTAKVELFPFIATRSQLQRSQVIREPHEMLVLLVYWWQGRGNY